MARLLLRADALFDGTRLVRAARVLVVDGVIAAIGSGEDPPHPVDTTVADLPGETLLPSLVDDHVHASLAGGMEPSQVAGEVAVTARANLRTAARAGIGVVRDCGSPGRVLLDLAQVGDGARVVNAGPVLTPSAGHGHGFGIEAEGIDALRAAVLALAADGVDFVKVIGSGGGTPGTDPRRPTYSVPELAAVREAAAGHDLAVTLHALNAETVRRGLAAGIRRFEHGWPATDDPEVHRRLAGELAAAGASVCPTVWAVAHRERTLLRVSDERPLDGRERHELSSVRQITARVMGFVAECHAAGVRLRAGTDAGWRDVRFGELVEELLILERCGMPALQVLAVATVDLRVSAAAEIVAVPGDPTADLGLLRRCRFVVRSGVLTEMSAAGA